MVIKFTHDRVIDYVLPGIPPTGRQVEIAAVVVAQFRDGKLASEHVYWDQASVLVQIGKLDPAGLPIAGVEVARKASDRSLPSNQLMAREWRHSEGKPI
jgi:carboxymethylenebutenolidase